MSTVWRCRTLRPTTQPGYGFLIQPMRKPDAYREIVDAPDPRSSTFEAPGPDRARHRADVGSEQWGRTRLCASRPPCGLTWPLPEGLDDESLELLLFPAPTTASQGDWRPTPDWAYVEKELRRRSVTRLLLWEECRAANPDGFGYTWFCTTFEAWKQRARPSMRQTHAGGEKVWQFLGDPADARSATVSTLIRLPDTSTWCCFL